jgi:methyl-accepting chemotaxis protein
MRAALSTKISALVGGSLLVLTIAVGVVTWFRVNSAFNAQTEGDLEILSNSVKHDIRQMETKALEVATLLATRPDVTGAVEQTNTAVLQKISRETLRQTGLELITIADAKGRVVARGHADKVGDDVSNQANVLKALAGEMSSAIEEGTVVKYSLRAGCPVRVGNQVIGSITTGYDISASHKLVDGIRQKYGVECTIFKGNTRVSTTLSNGQQRIVGTQLSNATLEESVLKKGQTAIGINTIQGATYNSV